MSSKKYLILLFLIIILILLFLLYENYKEDERNIIGKGFDSILSKENTITELENIEDVLNINVSDIKSMELSDIFDDKVYWNIEIDNNIFIKFDAINKKIENYKDNNDYGNKFESYVKEDESKKFIIDKYINLGYNNEYTLESLTKKEFKEGADIWEAVFITENEKIVFEYIPEINRIISIDNVQ